MQFNSLIIDHSDNLPLFIYICRPKSEKFSIVVSHCLACQSPFLSMQVADMTEEDKYTVYKGVHVLKGIHTTESLKYYEEFSFRPDDILIVTYPKSGKSFPGHSVEVNGE